MAASFRGILLSALCLVCVLAGCGTGRPTDEPDPPPVPTAEPERKAAGEEYLVKFETTAGDFTVRVVPEWAPLGAARFRELVESGFYDGARFFRVLPDFMVQFGINGNPSVSKKWKDKTIRDDRVVKSNQPGYITFATSGPNSRTTQVFINYADNARLDEMGFAPFGEVIEGMDSVKAIYSLYGERPQQDLIQSEGNAYLDRDFPKVDSIKTARIVGSEGEPRTDGAGAKDEAANDASSEEEAKGETKKNE